MRVRTAALCAAVTLAAAPVSAHASGANYKGGCGFLLFNDASTNGRLGGPDQWTGGVFAVTFATNAPGAAITIDCVLKVDSVDNGSVLSASGPGVNVKFGALSFSASSASIVELCDAVTIDGVAQPLDCGTATTTPVVPPVVIEAVDTVVQLANQFLCRPVGCVVGATGPLSGRMMLVLPVP